MDQYRIHAAKVDVILCNAHCWGPGKTALLKSLYLCLIGECKLKLVSIGLCIFFSMLKETCFC